jgi:hypothetical protein
MWRSRLLSKRVGADSGEDRWRRPLAALEVATAEIPTTSNGFNGRAAAQFEQPVQASPSAVAPAAHAARPRHRNISRKIAVRLCDVVLPP